MTALKSDFKRGFLDDTLFLTLILQYKNGFKGFFDNKEYIILTLFNAFTLQTLTFVEQLLHSIWMVASTHALTNADPTYVFIIIIDHTIET